MPAAVKLAAAFDFTVYGKLAHVGADTVVCEQERDPAPYNQMLVDPESSQLEGPGGIVDIRPGMQAEVELISSHRTVQKYRLMALFMTQAVLTRR